MRKFSNLEIENAKLATSVIEKSGGEVTFDEYDKLIYPIKYWVPLNWCAGWGLLRSQKKMNDDKMCAFVACDLGLIEQTKTGYRLIKQKQESA